MCELRDAGRLIVEAAMRYGRQSVLNRAPLPVPWADVAAAAAGQEPSDEAAADGFEGERIWLLRDELTT